MKKRGRKKQSTQAYFRKQQFSFHQYWIFYYTEKYPSGDEKDFSTFIKAKSYSLAKIILAAKVKEDHKGAKIKATSGYMLHKNYKHSSTNKHLTIEDWANIKKSCFPNINNFLFKKEIPRPEGYTNRFNKADAKGCKTIGFQKGDKNWSRQNRKGIVKSLHQRKGLKWAGDKWVKWDRAEMLHTKNKIISGLIANNNNRKHTAEYLGIGRNTLYKLMCRCEEIEWWNTEYPIEKRIPPRVPKEQRSATQKRVMSERRDRGDLFFDKSEEAEKKRIKNLQISLAKKRDEYRQSLIPKIKEAFLATDNVRTEAAKYLNVKYGTLKAWMTKTKSWVDWNAEYPSNYNKSKSCTWTKFKKE